MTDITTVPTELLDRLRRVYSSPDLLNRQIAIDYALDDLFTWISAHTKGD